MGAVRFMIKYPFRIIGVDPSMTSTGLTSLIFDGSTITIELKRIIETTPDLSFQFRLEQMRCEISDFYLDCLCKKNKCKTHAAIESPPQGARMFSSADTAKATAAAQMGLCRISQTIYTARAVKKFIVPDWHGWSKANWAKAGYTKKYKSSMPSKTSVASNLATRFGVNIAQPDMSDAAAVAIYHAHKDGLLPKGTKWQRENRLSTKRA